MLACSVARLQVDPKQAMKSVDLRILVINGGSSSIKFALFEAGDPPQLIFRGTIEGIGRPGAALNVKGPSSSDNLSRPHSSLCSRPACCAHRW